MKIAVLGDIHGNIDALNVAYDTALSNNVDKIYHLGDFGGYAPSVNEVVDFIIEHSIEGVQGNYDDAVANDKEHCGCKYEDMIQSAMATLSFQWTKEHATEKSKDYMRGLPFDIALSVQGRRVSIFHATPLKNNLYWYNDRDEDFFFRMARKSDADIMIYGHTHIPYRKNLGSKIFINAGSVGKPKDGDTRTCLCIVDIKEDDVITDFIRIPYDIQKVSSSIIVSGLPTYFAEKLTAGK